MSMINRHNYEEFFLLYADDELNHQQRAAVELFVQQNPDMAAELETCMLMKLQPEDDIVFADKSVLYKTADVDININNYEEFFFLYIDRELDETTRAKVEKFVLQHPQLQDEFTLLKQTVLQPEAVMFGDKSGLYRKEETRRVYPLFMRFAAAAAVIGIAVLGWLFYAPGTTHPAGGPGVAVNTKKVQPVTNPVITSLKQIPQQVAPTQQDVQKSTVNVTKKAQKQQDKINGPLQQVNIVEQPNQQPVIDTPGDEVAQNNIKTVTENPVITTNPVGIAGTIQKDATANTGSRPTDNITYVDDPNKVEEHIGGPNAGTAYTVPYKVIDTDDENRSMYVGSLEFNKDKIKGFLKRAGRIFGSKAKRQTE